MRLTPRLIAAFAVVYLVWGSTYLAIRYAVESIPPFLLGGIRFTIAGSALYAYTRLMGAKRPAPIHWRSALAVGALLLLGGNGLVNYAEQTISSGLAALIVGSTPIWMVLFEWLFFGGKKPSVIVWAGLAMGMAGIVVLIDPRKLAAGGANLLGTLAVLGACMSWTIGSLASRRMTLPASPLNSTAMQMLSGGAALLAVATLRGEWSRFHPASVHAHSWIALAYLIVMGSLLAFSTYIWLLRHASPAAISTYAYVNPVVAVLLGWAIADEKIGANTILAAGMIVASIALITLRKTSATSRAATAPIDELPPSIERSSEPMLCKDRG